MRTKRKDTKRKQPLYPRKATPPDAYGYPHYAAILRANRRLKKAYEATLASRLAERRKIRRSASPSAWLKHAARIRRELVSCLGVATTTVKRKGPRPRILRRTDLVEWNGSKKEGLLFRQAWYALDSAGWFGETIEVLELQPSQKKGPLPRVLWIPASGPCFTGAESPDGAAGRFGLDLARAGHEVVIPRLPALEAFSIIQSRARIIEGASAVGAMVGEAAEVLGGLLSITGRSEYPDQRVWVGGKGVGGLVALCLGALDRRVAGVMAMDVPALGESTVHESLLIPRFNATTDLEECAALMAPRPLLVSTSSRQINLGTLKGLYKKLGRSSACSSARKFPEVLAWLAKQSQAKETPRPSGVPLGMVERGLSPQRRFKVSNFKTRQQWLKHRPELIRAYKKAFGIDRKPKAIAVKKVSTAVLSDYVREEYHVETAPNCLVNLTFLRPKGAAGRTPTVLCLPGSGSDVGRVEAEYGHEVVSEGWNAAIIDARSALYLFHPHIAERTSLITQGVRDILACTDHVFKRRDVDQKRVACMGVSQGGTHSWMLASLDERIVASVPVCGLCTYRSVIDNQVTEYYGGNNRSFLDSHSIYYYIPGLLRLAEQQDLSALIAPRAFAVIGANRDNCFPLDGMREAVRDLKHIYRLQGAPEKFKYIEFDGPHSMPEHTRRKAYQFIRKAFKGQEV